MKHKTLITLIAVALLSPALSHVLAEDSSVGVSASTSLRANIELKKIELQKIRDNFRANASNTREQMKQDGEEKKTEMQGVRRDFLASVAKNQLTRATRNFNETIARLQQIMTRIQSRITKIKAAGGNTTSAEASISLAQGNITDAQVTIAAFSTLDLSGASTTARANFEIVKTAAAKAKTSLKSAHDNLVAAVRSLSDEQEKVKVSEESTTTESH